MDIRLTGRATRWIHSVRTAGAARTTLRTCVVRASGVVTDRPAMLKTRGRMSVTYRMDKYTYSIPPTTRPPRHQVIAWVLLCGWLGASAGLLFNHMQNNPLGVCTTRIP